MARRSSVQSESEKRQHLHPRRWGLRFQEDERQVAGKATRLFLPTLMAERQEIDVGRGMDVSQTTPLRAFQPSDLANVHRLIHHVLDTCYSGIYPPRAVQFFKQFHSEDKILQRSRDGVLIVIERDDVRPADE